MANSTQKEDFSIATARIHGLNSNPYFFDHRCYWAYDIWFDESSTMKFTNLPCIKAGNTEKEAKKFWAYLNYKFNLLSISEGDKVAIIFDKNGNVRYISAIGENSWIDMCDNNFRTTQCIFDKFESLRVY